MLCLTDIGALRTMKIHSYPEYTGMKRTKRTWLNTLAGHRKKSCAGLCMMLSELHYFLELLEFAYTLSLFDQKYVCRGTQKCLLYLLKKLSHEKNLGALCLFSVVQSHRGHSLLPCYGKCIQSIIFALYWNSFMDMQNTTADPYFKQSFSPWT